MLSKESIPRSSIDHTSVSLLDLSRELLPFCSEIAILKKKVAKPIISMVMEMIHMSDESQKIYGEHYALFKEVCLQYVYTSQTYELL